MENKVQQLNGLNGIEDSSKGIVINSLYLSTVAIFKRISHL